MPCCHGGFGAVGCQLPDRGTRSVCGRKQVSVMDMRLWKCCSIRKQAGNGTQTLFRTLILTQGAHCLQEEGMSVAHPPGAIGEGGPAQPQPGAPADAPYQV